jgi:hypothetical protein
MKLPATTSKASLILAGAVALALTGFQARADVADLNITGADALGIAFSNDLDSATGWTVTGGTSTFGGTQNGETVWQPQTPGVDTNPQIVTTLATPLNIANGSISIYYRMQVQTTATSLQNRLIVELDGAGGNNGTFRFEFGPGGASNTKYFWRNSTGVVNQTTQNAFFPSTTAFVNYRLTLAMNPDSTFSLTAYHDAASDGNYVVWGGGALDVVPVATGTDAVIGTGGTGVNAPGNFSSLLIRQSNGTGGTPANNADWLDAVVVTQAVPEPSTYAMIIGGLSGLSVLMCVRRLSRKGRHTA